MDYLILHQPQMPSNWLWLCIQCKSWKKLELKKQVLSQNVRSRFRTHLRLICKCSKRLVLLGISLLLSVVKCEAHCCRTSCLMVYRTLRVCMLCSWQDTGVIVHYLENVKLKSCEAIRAVKTWFNHVKLSLAELRSIQLFWRISPLCTSMASIYRDWTELTLWSHRVVEIRNGFCEVGMAYPDHLLITLNVSTWKEIASRTWWNSII